MIAKVSIDRRSSSIASLYDYNVPTELTSEINVGASVFVPFGYDQVFGYVVELSGETKEGLKDIVDIVNDANQIGDINFKLAEELARDLDSSMANVLSMMQPAFIKGQKQQYLYIEDYNKLDGNLALALNGKSKVLITSSLLPFKKQIQAEIKNGNIVKGYEFFVYGKNKKIKTYSVIDDSMQSTKSRDLVVRYLVDHPGATLDDIRVATNVSSNIVKTLVNLKVLKVTEVVVTRGKTLEKKNKSKYEFSFSEKEIVDYYSEVSQKPFLFFSSNEEFRLHFYIKLISEAELSSKKVIIIYPNALSVEEACLSLKRYLRGYDIISYHSKNTNSENYDSYQKILTGDYDVLIGTPNALLLPIDKVSDMILNDVDDEMYINETYPYLNYKEAAIKKAKLLECKIILESATPVVADYYKTMVGKYYILNNHFESQANADIVDMNKEVLETNDVILSSILKQRLDEAISKKLVSVLICNNVAFATQIKCRKCGKVLKCPNCKVPLVYVKSKDAARCPYCNYEEKMFKSCKCGSTNYISLGFGLEQVEEKLKGMYPEAKIIRADSAFLNSKEKMESLLQGIEEGSIDIIIGTNALTKINKYPNIDLVGLLYVDSFLNANNYSGSEATYNLIAKVSAFPHLVIQTYNPTHYSIVNAINNNYEDYYELELQNRELLEYPPFKDLSIIFIKGDYQEMYHFAFYFKKAVSHSKDIVFLGPTYDYIRKGVKLIIKYNDYEGVNKLFNDSVKHFNSSKVMATLHRYTRGG